MSGSRYFRVELCDRVPVLHLQPIGFDRVAVNEFGQELFAYVDQHRPPGLVVNLAAVTEFSSPTLARLMMLDKRMTAYGGKLLICEGRGSVREVISLVWPASLGPAAEPLTEADAVERVKNLADAPS